MRKTDDEDEDPSKGRGENITPFYISEEEVQNTHISLPNPKYISSCRSAGIAPEEARPHILLDR